MLGFGLNMNAFGVFFTISFWILIAWFIVWVAKYLKNEEHNDECSGISLRNVLHGYAKRR